MTTLEDLSYGNITPFEQYLDCNEKYNIILNEMSSMAEVKALKYYFRLAINNLNEV